MVLYQFNQANLNSLEVKNLYEELTDNQAEVVSGGARPCRDENDTNCYSLVTLECRVIEAVVSDFSG